MKTMTIIISAIAKSQLGKWFFGIMYSTNMLSVLQESMVNNQSFFDSLSENIPAKVMTVLAVIYALILVGERIYAFYKKIRLGNIEIKKEKECLEQEEIETDKRREENN